MQYLFRSSARRHFGQDLVCKLSDQLSSSTVHGSSVLCWQLYIRHPGDILYLSINLSSSSCSFQLRRGATADSHSGARTLATTTASCNQDQEIGPPKCNCIAERLRPNYAVQSRALERFDYPIGARNGDPLRLSRRAIASRLAGQDQHAGERPALGTSCYTLRVCYVQQAHTDPCCHGSRLNVDAKSTSLLELWFRLRPKRSLSLLTDATPHAEVTTVR